MKLFVCLALLTGCSYFQKNNESHPATGERLDELLAKAERYTELAPETRDSDGWILTDECDALLHSSLAASGGSVEYPVIARARSADGQWFRRPSMDCLSSNSSKSSISRDMLLGLMISIATFRDYDSAKRLVQYADDNLWVMGDHDGSLDGQSRVLVSPSFYKLMTDVRDYAKTGALVELPEESSVGLSKISFTDHLDALAILLRGQISGAISGRDLGSIKNLTELDPNNALFWAIRSRYTDGNQTQAISILLREDLFPADRLPTARERKVPYLWMHGEKASDWDGIDSDHVHPGHDLTFVTWVING